MPHRILVADDHAGIRHRVRSVLETAGFEVCGEAANGLDAVTKTKLLTPDLIILDLFMPVMNGLQAIPEIAKSAPSVKSSYSPWTTPLNYDKKPFAAGRTAT
jgi:DNA-binding NarL/FixJ family response regulator